ncbi:MAG: hypothetical protein PHS82_00940 [Lachnospiraceae bacterium]|nr:hypothetical protein [Lachnospiraceae bacterium]
MKNMKTTIGIIGGLILVGAAAFGMIQSNAQKASAQAATDIQTVSKKETEEVLDQVAVVKDESDMIYLQANAEGTLKAEDAGTNLPVSVKVSYYLNNIKMTPEEIAGKSGKVRIKFEYENLTSETVDVEGETLTVNTPFMMISAVMLSSDTFTNAEVSNGKVMEQDDGCIAVGMAFPSLKDNLQLDTVDMTKDMDIPDYVEITADATEFELDFTANIIAPVGFSEIDENGFDDVDALIDSMDELGEASEALVDGTGTLLDGLKTFQTAVGSYTDGVDQLSTGIKAIHESLAGVTMPDADSMDAVTAAADTLTQDAAALSDGMTKLQTTFASLQSFAQNVMAYKAAVEGAISTASIDLANAQTAVAGADETATSQAQSQAQGIRDAIEAVVSNMENLTEEDKAAILAAADYSTLNINGTAGDAAGAIADAQAQLTSVPAFAMPDMSVDASGIISTLADMERQMKVLGAASAGMSGLTDGIDTLTDALEQLQSGADQLSNNNSQIMEGIQALIDGADQLKEGQQTFDEEGIQELQDMAGDELQNLITRFKAVRKAEIAYKETIPEDTNYVVETDSIEMK